MSCNENPDHVHFRTRKDGIVYTQDCDGSCWDGKEQRYDGDCCWRTKCPECNGPVFFVRHNGGSVWFDALGLPWPKHACMDSSTRYASWESTLLDIRETIPQGHLGIVRTSNFSRRLGKWCKLYVVAFANGKQLEFAASSDCTLASGMLVVPLGENSIRALRDASGRKWPVTETGIGKKESGFVQDNLRSQNEETTATKNQVDRVKEEKAFEDLLGVSYSAATKWPRQFDNLGDWLRAGSPSETRFIVRHDCDYLLKKEILVEFPVLGAFAVKGKDGLFAIGRFIGYDKPAKSSKAKNSKTEKQRSKKQQSIMTEEQLMDAYEKTRSPKVLEKLCKLRSQRGH